MNEFVITKDMLLILSPLILLQLGLAVYCGVKIFREGVQNLNRWAWLFICLLVDVIGPVLFLLVGRRKECK
ncbi:MAG: PLDc_N domain-containing protein [Firmicutes bacterium]|nr:PLDc_N domain-containing protein [Bacillota bacterium]